MKPKKQNSTGPSKKRLEMAAKGLLTAMMEKDGSKARPSPEAMEIAAKLMANKAARKIREKAPAKTGICS